MEDNRNGRKPPWKTTSMENDLNGRQPQWKTISMEDRKQMTSACLTSKPCTELGPAQPQLVFLILSIWCSQSKLLFMITKMQPLWFRTCSFPLKLYQSYKIIETFSVRLCRLNANIYPWLTLNVFIYYAFLISLNHQHDLIGFLRYINLMFIGITITYLHEQII